MKNDWIEMIKEFQKTYGLPIRSKPGILPYDEVALRMSLIAEEVEETFNAIGEEDLVEILDGVVDSLYVVIGMAVQMGFGDKLDEAFREVHRSNMSKLEDGKPLYREDGKVLKGSNFTPPDLKSIIDA